VSRWHFPEERVRRSRVRRKKGLFCLMLELRETEVDVLVARARLRPEERASAAAIKKAVYSVLDDFVAASTPFRATVKPGKASPGAAA
jgi:hypothetical protein